MLLIAALYGYTDAVKVLLENGADVHIRNQNGETPLHKSKLKLKKSLL
jgi:ankyrin repeat protein